MEKVCLECGAKLMGREDKKFCHDACRNAYNNKKNRDATNLIRNTNLALKKNYRILEDLNTDGKTKIFHKKLKDNGFDFSLITSIYQTKTNKTYYFVYDQGYMWIDQEWLILVKRN